MNIIRPLFFKTETVQAGQDDTFIFEECYKIKTTNPLLIRKWVMRKITNRLTGAFRYERKYLS